MTEKSSENSFFKEKEQIDRSIKEKYNSIRQKIFDNTQGLQTYSVEEIGNYSDQDYKLFIDKVNDLFQDDEQYIINLLNFTSSLREAEVNKNKEIQEESEKIKPEFQSLKQEIMAKGYLERIINKSGEPLIVFHYDKKAETLQAFHISKFSIYGSNPEWINKSYKSLTNYIDSEESLTLEKVLKYIENSAEAGIAILNKGEYDLEIALLEQDQGKNYADDSDFPINEDLGRQFNSGSYNIDENKVKADGGKDYGEKDGGKDGGKDSGQDDGYLELGTNDSNNDPSLPSWE